MSHSPTGDEALAEKVSDSRAPRESAEEFWRHFVAVGGEQLKNLLKPHPAQTSTDGSRPPEIPPENECWQAFSDMAEKHIAETAESLRNQLDNTLLFATLFSAINSAFLIYTLPTATTSAQDPTNQLLLYIIQGMNNESASSASHFLAAAESSGHTVNITVNAIFSISLMLSIIATLTAVLGQTWVTNYSRNIAADPQDLREERQRKVLAADRWYFQPLLEIVLPIILQLALVIFCVGFTVLLWSINKPLAIAVLPVLGFGFLAIAASVGCALWDPDCPYQTPISSRILPKLLSGAYALWYYGSSVVISLMLPMSRLLRPAQLGASARRREDEESLGNEVSLEDEVSSASSASSTDDGDSNSYHMKRHGLAAKLRRPLDSTGIQQAESVIWALNHSSDAVAVGKVISTLLHGDTKHAADIGNDVYRHPVFDQLLSGARKSLNNTKSNSQQAVWKASFRAVWHVFLAPSVVLPPNTLQRTRFESLLDLEAAIIEAASPAYLHDLHNFEDVLEVASRFKLLQFLSSYLSQEDLRNHTHFAKLLKRVDTAVYWSSVDSTFSFHRLHYLGELIAALTKQMNDSVTTNPGSVTLRLIFDLYDGLRRDCEPVWNMERSSPPIRSDHLICLAAMMQEARALTKIGPITMLQTSCGRWYFEILRSSLTSSTRQVNTAEWDTIRDQLKEVNLSLKASLEGEGDRLYMKCAPDSEEPLQGLLFECRQSVKWSDIQGTGLYLAKFLLDARTLGPGSKETLQGAELVSDVTFQLLKIIDRVPQKYPNVMLHISLTFLQILAGLDFPSLYWRYLESSIPVIVGLCQATTEWARRDERAREVDPTKLEDLNILAANITHKMLELMADEGYERNSGSGSSDEVRDELRQRFWMRIGVEDVQDQITFADTMPYLTDFLRDVEVEDLTERKWTALENLEWNLQHEKYDDKPAYAAARTEYVQQMKVVRDKRERSSYTLNHDNALPSTPQEKTGIHQEPREVEAVPSSVGQSGTGKGSTAENPETTVEEAPIREDQIEEGLDMSMKDKEGGDSTDLSK